MGVHYHNFRSDALNGAVCIICGKTLPVRVAFNYMSMYVATLIGHIDHPFFAASVPPSESASVPPSESASAASPGANGVVGELWARMDAAKANRLKLDSCSLHKFSPNGPVVGEYVCSRCGGKADMNQVKWYQDGLGHCLDLYSP